MTASLRDCSETCRTLRDAAVRLDEQAEDLRLPPLSGREWFELLRGKLLPQLTEDPFLIAAVVGGTNIGKSVVFNHLAGTHASAISPYAAGTKHPVCLVPAGFRERHDLAAIFEGFSLREWENEEAALEESDRDLLFWRTDDEAAENLLVLDTPDVDSNARVNWERADKVRRAADVLVAVLTQEKYNDAAVKQFFRHAADEDKAVIVVFNKLELPEDERFWPGWLAVFCRETGVVPEYVYLAPRDRRAAEALELPFHEREWPIADGAVPETGIRAGGNDSGGQSLAEAISRFRFDEIKLRSLRGALRRVVDERAGAPAWLTEVAGRTETFRAAAERVGDRRLVRVEGWPGVPLGVVFEEFWDLWRNRRTGWSRTVTRFYDRLNAAVSTPVTLARDYAFGKPADPMERYRDSERAAVQQAVDAVFEQLRDLADISDELIRPHFEQVLSGRSREVLITDLEAEHAAADLRGDLRRLVREDMAEFFGERPKVEKFLNRLDVAAVAARPVLSSILFLGGAAGVDIAAQTLVNVAVDLVAGSAAVAVGDAVVAKGGGEVAASVVAWLRGIPRKFARQRAAWLAERLKVRLLGTLPDQLRTAADLPRSEAFRDVQESVARLRGLVAAAERPASAQRATRDDP